MTIILGMTDPIIRDRSVFMPLHLDQILGENKSETIKSEDSIDKPHHLPRLPTEERASSIVSVLLTQQ
jgi:hypothetical protein